MSTEEIAELLASYTTLQQSHDSLQQSHDTLRESYEQLSRQVAWFKRQLFGRKSEQRITDAERRQLTLGERPQAEEPEGASIEVPAHRRRRRIVGTAEEEKLRFDASVPVEEILLEPEGWDEAERGFDAVAGAAAKEMDEAFRTYYRAGDRLQSGLVDTASRLFSGRWSEPGELMNETWESLDRTRARVQEALAEDKAET